MAVEDNDRREVIVERDRRGPGVGTIVAIVVLVLIVLFVLFGGWRWFGGTSNTTNIQAPSVSAPTTSQ